MKTADVTTKTIYHVNEWFAHEWLSFLIDELEENSLIEKEFSSKEEELEYEKELLEEEFEHYGTTHQIQFSKLIAGEKIPLSSIHPDVIDALFEK